tara:strand:+ start:908 stop:1246 length:339 start_codon:yes stop_codon:yes gene_type:complete
MPGKNTKIVILGKSSSAIKDTRRAEILRNMNATDVPREYIDTIDVHLHDGQVIPFEVDELIDNFSLDELRGFLSAQAIKGKVELVEIFLDLDKIFTQLEAKTNTIFKDFFED